VRAARVLYNLGEKEKALKIFARLGEELNRLGQGGGRVVAVNDRSPHRDLVHTELQLGLKDAAHEHFGTLVERAGGPAALPQLWEEVFPRNRATAETWWKLHRRHPPP